MEVLPASKIRQGFHLRMVEKTDILFLFRQKCMMKRLKHYKQRFQNPNLGINDKNTAIKKLHEIASRAEKDFIPNNNFDALIEKERNDSWKYGGKTVFGDAKKPKQKDVQLKLF